MLLCEADRASMEVAKAPLMMGLLSSFQSERHIAPYVIFYLYIILFYQAYGYPGRDNSGALRRSEAVVLFFILFQGFQGIIVLAQ